MLGNGCERSPACVLRVVDEVAVAAEDADVVGDAVSGGVGGPRDALGGGGRPGREEGLDATGVGVSVFVGITASAAARRVPSRRRGCGEQEDARLVGGGGRRAPSRRAGRRAPRR